MLRITLCFAGLVWAMPCAASAIPTEQDAFGCKSMANASHLLGLRQTGHAAEYDSRLQKWVRAGECRVWDATAAMSVEDESEGLVCLTPEGMHGLCYWSPRTGAAAAP